MGRFVKDTGLSLFFLAIFVLAVVGQAFARHAAVQHGEPPMTWAAYLATPDFWNRTLQNWQSEFLAVGCMVAFSIYLRQRGSAESKPVGTPNHVTSEESQ